MKAKLFIAALIATITTSFAAVAADPPAKDTTVAPVEQPAKAAPAKKKVKKHSHVEAKGGPAPTEATGSNDQPARPPHDHMKEK